MYSNKSRYIHHKQNTIKHLISNGVIFIDYVKSKENIVEHHTKDLMRELMYIWFIKRNGFEAFKDESIL